MADDDDENTITKIHTSNCAYYSSCSFVDR